LNIQLEGRGDSYWLWLPSPAISCSRGNSLSAPEALGKPVNVSGSEAGIDVLTYNYSAVSPHDLKSLSAISIVVPRPDADPGSSQHLRCRPLATAKPRVPVLELAFGSCTTQGPRTFHQNVFSRNAVDLRSLHSFCPARTDCLRKFQRENNGRVWPPQPRLFQFQKRMLKSLRSKSSSLVLRHGRSRLTAYTDLARPILCEAPHALHWMQEPRRS